MGLSVYTTQFPKLLQAAVTCPPTDSVCFRSKKWWAKAAKLLDRYRTLPILFRKQEDSDEAHACRFVAELVEIFSPDRFDSNAARTAWLDDKLWLQRDTIRRTERSEHFPTCESRFKATEIDEFLNAKTWYIVRNLREIRPLPLPRLRKLSDGYPLAENYNWGYALCYYPEDEVEVIGGRGAAV